MHLHAHYLQLCDALDRGGEQLTVKITLEEIADTLYCTPRNAKLLLKKMAESGWIRWKPGRGRGNVSELQFVMPRELIIMESAMESAEKGDLEEALKLIDASEQRIKLKDTFVGWMFKRFGYREVQTDEKQLATMHIPLKSPIVTLDPARVTYAVDSHIARHVFDTLVAYDPERDVFEPYLAYHWEHNGDCSSWTFYLRKGVRFHNGRELTAEDVAFTFNRLLDPEGPTAYRWLMEQVDQTVVIDRYVLEVRLRTSNYLFLRMLHSVGASIVPKDVYDTAEYAEPRLPVGTGAFRVERVNDYMIRLKAFDDYYGYRPHLDLIEMWVMPDGSDEIEAFSSVVWGEVACDRRGAKVPFPILGGATDRWEQIEKTTYGCGLLTFNLRKSGPLQDERWRSAIDLLIGRESMVSSLGGNRIGPARGFYPESNYVDVTPMNVQEAKARIQASAYANERLKLYTYVHHEVDARWVVEQCALGGLEVELVILSEKEMADEARIGEADMIIFQFVAEDDQICVFELLKMSNSFVRAHLSPTMAQLVDDRLLEIWAQPDEIVRRRKFGELIAELHAEKAFLFMLHKTWRTAYPGSVKGVKFNSFGLIDFKQIWFPHRGAKEGNRTTRSES